MSSRRRRFPFVLGLTLLLGAGCGSGGGASKRSTPTTAGGSATTAGPIDEAKGVTLDEPGAPPRQALVLRLAAGTTTRAALVTELGLQMTLDGEPAPIGALPSTRMVLEQHVDGVDADGSAHYTVTIVDVSVLGGPGVSPTVVSETQRKLDQVKGLRGTGTIDAHGGNQTASFDTSGVTDAQLKSTLDSVASQVGNLSAPFPTEPVGIGGRWTARRTAEINGLTLDTTTRYQLKSRTGDHYDLDVAQDAQAATGAAAMPNLPTGTEASVDGFTLHTSGSVAGDLTRQFPITSTVDGSGDGTFTVSQGSQHGTLSEHLTLTLALSAA